MNYKLGKLPPVEIQDDYYFYKSENPMRCLVCNQYSANFVHLTFKNDIIYFWLNCIECGENSFWFITKKKLKAVFLRWFFDPNIDPESSETAWWRMFRLGRYYDSCFKNKSDQERFGGLWNDLEKDLNKFRRRLKK